MAVDTLEARALILKAIRRKLTDQLNSDKNWVWHKGCERPYRQKEISFATGYDDEDGRPQDHSVVISAYGTGAYPGNNVSVEIDRSGQRYARLINHIGQIMGPVAYFEHLCRSGDQHRTENIGWLVEKIMYFFPMLVFTCREMFPPMPRKPESEAEVDSDPWFKCDWDGNIKEWDTDQPSIVSYSDGHWILLDFAPKQQLIVCKSDGDWIVLDSPERFNVRHARHRLSVELVGNGGGK